MYAKPCAKERLILAVAGATTRNGRPDLTFQKELECWILKQNFLIFFFFKWQQSTKTLKSCGRPNKMFVVHWFVTFC